MRWVRLPNALVPVALVAAVPIAAGVRHLPLASLRIDAGILVVGLADASRARLASVLACALVAVAGRGASAGRVVRAGLTIGPVPVARVHTAVLVAPRVGVAGLVRHGHASRRREGRVGGETRQR